LPRRPAGLLAMTGERKIIKIMLIMKDKVNKIIEYGLYLLAFLLPLQTRWIIKAGMVNNGSFEYGTISLYGTDILLIILIGMFFYSNKSKIENRKLKIPLIWWLIAGLDLFIFISIWLAPDKILALYKYGVFLLGVGLFWLVIKANYDKTKLIYYFLAGVFLQSILGCWQFLTQSSFANKWFGLALHDPAELGTSVIEAMGSDGYGERWLRAYGSLDHPNIIGGVLVAGILFCLYLILDKNYEKISKSPSTGSGQAKFLISKQIIFYCFLFTFITALFFTFSRAAWLAVIIGVAIILVGLIVEKDLRGQRQLLPLILVSVFLIFSLYANFKNLVDTRMTGESRLETKSNNERIVSYQEAWQVIKKHPFFGVGIGNYSLAVKNEIAPKEQSWYYQPTHNTFLLVLSEVGVFGVVFFAGLFLYILIINFQLSILNKFLIFNFQFKNIFFQNILNISLICALIILMFFDHWLWSLHFGVLLFWFLLGLILRDSGELEKVR